MRYIFKKIYIFSNYKNHQTHSASLLRTTSITVVPNFAANDDQSMVRFPAPQYYIKFMVYIFKYDPMPCILSL
jgi:hypothetical protein